MTKRCKNGVFSFYDQKKSDEIKGIELKSKKYKLPKRDRLSYNLYNDGEDQYLVVKVRAHIFIFIPLYYDQYIIQFGKTKYDIDSFSFEDALDEIEQAGNWIHRSKMNPFNKNIDTVEFYGKSFDKYKIGKRDYQFLIYNI